MEKYIDINEDGHSIRCKLYENETRGVRRWVVAAHGFGGTKESSAIKKFADRLLTKYKSFGVIAFDWPCHGKDARNKLVLSECLNYLALVNRYAKEQLGAQALYNYSASMGAYMTLLFLHTLGNPYEKIVLRCPAIDLFSTMCRQMSEAERETFSKKGEVKFGFTRKILITKDFLADVKAHDLTKYEYFDDADRILLFHGTKDTVVPFSGTSAFADDNAIELIPVENANHTFSNPDSMDFVISRTIIFFNPAQV